MTRMQHLCLSSWFHSGYCETALANGSRSRAGVLTFTAFFFDVVTQLMNLHDFETSDAEHLSDTDDIYTTHHVYNLTETMTWHKSDLFGVLAQCSVLVVASPSRVSGKEI